MCVCEQVKADLSRLRPRERAALILKRRDGMSFEEIAEVTGLQANDVRHAFASGLFALVMARHERKAAGNE
jgi:DNA-directed RNA polymerase specialized sigma24 family protein